MPQRWFPGLTWLICGMILLGLGLVAAPLSSASTAGIQGTITAAQSGLPIHGVTITVLDPEDATVIQRARTDFFGRFRATGIEPGAYSVEASHPGYHPRADAGVIVSAGATHAWDRGLVLKHPYMDLHVEVACVTTGMKLAGVPVQIRLTPAAGGSDVVVDLETNEVGYAHVPGLPTGFAEFRINEGPDKLPGWESHSRGFSRELTGDHWVDALLKPDPNWLLISVYGFDPRTEEDGVPLEGIVVECEGVHPKDPEIVLLPVQTGVSGIRREGDVYWDNTMAGKVRFHTLPPIHWRIQGKALGYRLTETMVTPDADGRLAPNELRIDMALQDTVLTVVLDSPYLDPAMLDGAEVRIQGLVDSNTEGIDRIRTATFVADDNRTVAVFDKILPGRYLTTLNATVQHQVPIIIGGVDVNAGKSDAYSIFTASFTATDYLDAFADANHDAVLFCEPEPTMFSGRLLVAETMVVDDPQCSLCVRPVFEPGASRLLEFRVSEYFAAQVPEALHRTEVETDAWGAFTVTLLPGMYGVTTPGMEDYWGSDLELEDIQTGAARTLRWPHHQVWPHSLASARAYQQGTVANPVSSIGGVALSSGRSHIGTLHAMRQLYALSANVPPFLAENTPYEFQVVGIDRASSDGVQNRMPNVARASEYFMGMVDGGGGQASISGPVSATLPLENHQWTAASLFRDLPPGTYNVSFSHPELNQRTNHPWIDPPVITFQAFPPPGIVPAEPFPDLDWVDRPMAAGEVMAAAEPPDYGSALVDVYQWQDSSEGGQYVFWQAITPQFIRPSGVGERIFYYRGINYNNWWDRWGAATPMTPFEMWLCLKDTILQGVPVLFDDLNEHWFHFTSPGGDLYPAIYIGGPTPTPEVDPLVITNDLYVRAIDVASGTAITGVQVTLSNEPTVSTPALVSDRVRNPGVPVTASHPSWRYHSREVTLLGMPEGRLQFDLTVRMVRGISMRGIVLNEATGNPVPGATVRLWNRYGSESRMGSPTLEDGAFDWPHEMGDEGWFLEIAAPGFLPWRVRLAPELVVPDPQDHRTNAYLFEGEQAIRLTPVARPAVLADSIAMNRRGAFLPGAKRAGNQSVFDAFTADGPLTMTWSLDVELPQAPATVTLPGFDREDGSAGDPLTVSRDDSIREVWLVDLRNFPNSSYNDEAVLLEIPELPEPAMVDTFLDRAIARTEGFENVFLRRESTRTPDPGRPGVVTATGQVKLWGLPHDRFRPAFIVVTRLGAVSIHALEYTGNREGMELTGARLPPWFAGMADIMGSVAGSQALLGDGLKDALPRGRFFPLPSFTANVILRPSGALDYVYAIDTEIQSGAANSAGGIIGLGPGFLGLNFHAGAEATLKGEDREFYLQIKGGLSRQSMNTAAFRPALLRRLDPVVTFRPAPTGEFYHIDSYVFDPDNRPAELAVLHGISGQVGAEASASLVPVLQFIPKVGPVLLMLKEADALDIRGLTRGMVGVRALEGFRTTPPHQVEHYPLASGETRQPRRHFLGGSELGDPVQSWDSEQTSSLDIAVGLGVGVDVRAFSSLGARGLMELAGDDAFTGHPALLLDINPRGDYPLVQRARGDLRAALEVYLETWAVRFQKRWEWKAWPIDYQYGTESVLHLIEMDITAQRRDLGEFGPANFLGQYPVIIDDLPPWSRVLSRPGIDGDRLFFTDETAFGGMALRTSLRAGADLWGPPVTIADSDGIITGADVISLPDGAGYLATWVEIAAEHRASPLPPSRILYALGNADASVWSAPAEAADFADVARDPRLFRHGDGVGLAFLRAPGGPSEPAQGLHGMVWTNAQWSQAADLADAIIHRFEVLGSSTPEQTASLVAFQTPDNGLWLVRWTDSGPAAATILADDAGGAFAFAEVAQHRFLTYGAASSGITLLREQETSWLPLGDGLPGAWPRELCVASIARTEGDCLVLLWTQSDGEATALWQAVVDLDGAPLGEPLAVPGQADGDYRSPRLLASTLDGAPHATVVFDHPDGRRQVHGLMIDLVPQHALAYDAAGGGTITGESRQSVPHGGSGAEVIAAPDPGALFTTWSDGVLTATRTDTPITGNLHVTAFFQSVGGVPIDWYEGIFQLPRLAETWADVDLRIPDSRGLTLGQIYTAVIDPTDSSSIFRVESITVGDRVEVRVHPSISDRRYTLWRSIDLVEWIAVPGQVDVPGGLSPLEDTAPPSRGFYRVTVDLP